MSAYNEFVIEREKIDYLVEKGYIIKGVTENLSGAFLEFEYRGIDSSKSKTEMLHIENADARKHFTDIIIKQRKQGV